jgi:chromosome condensin MukBEF ATPase and DNA-binding subunit MukB
MTEIITDYLDAKQLADRLTALELHSTSELARLEQERDEARDAIVGWENKWKCAVDMAARAEIERDEALKCAKEYYVEFIRNASSDNKVSKPNPLNPFYKLT